MQILASCVKTLKSRDIILVWGDHRLEEVTWKQENDMRTRYSELFQELGTF